ncbi:very long-chain acyl-CoA synthetase-like [Carcharodon carcharias]|uniref:very long-chain acyl-CoA synthetase-like n=1 Tax=Carcharodon carcharias TaxID=13397 RepID=UPI001B7ED557|nr:very long-chain acyl-CoA synthetase-like [Carcharodon carcharias]
MFTFYSLLAALLLSAWLLRIWFPYWWLDLKTFYKMFSLGLRVESYRKKTPAFTLLDVFLLQVHKCPNKPFLVFEGRTFSYSEMDRQSNKVARALQARARLKEGDCVAMLMANEPLFVTVWLALIKLGCAVAFLNYNIKGKSLIHSFQTSGAQVLVTTSELRSLVEEVLPSLREENATVFILDDTCSVEGIENLNDTIQAASDQPLSLSLRSHITFNSPFVYIYTSGTTGLPKAAIMTHGRVHLIATFISGCGLSSNDVIYTSLPLYHSAASLVGIGGCICLGATVVLRRKFSVSQFWDDCRKYHVTVIQYIGEVLRYLCNAPKKSNDGNHKVRMAIGNGARAEVWKEFLNRFGDIHVCEFYGSTEGNVGFLNNVGKIGASGRVTFLTRKLMPFQLVKYDAEREAPVRDSNGHCIEVAKGETGLLIAKITTKTPFIGYAGSRTQTDKKHLRDVFSKGDLYFNSGDLLMLDHDNFIYFQDRIGDTFRWKGENVSTTEVADILSTLDFVQEVCVYGVMVPGHEGRVGMAAIQLQSGKDLDGAQLYKHVAAQLPSYAQPRFLRVQTRIETTGTYKYYKVMLVKEGFNPATVQDPLFFLDEQKKTYIQMDQEIYNSVISNQIRL